MLWLCVFFVFGAHAKPNLPAPPSSCGHLAAIEVTLASGFSINLGSVRDKRLFNIELANGAHEYEAVLWWNVMVPHATVVTFTHSQPLQCL